jgi:hypothetical protein
MPRRRDPDPVEEQDREDAQRREDEARALIDAVWERLDAIGLAEIVDAWLVDDEWEPGSLKRVDEYIAPEQEWGRT